MQTIFHTRARPETLPLLLLVAVLGACGSGTRPHTATEWTANAKGVVAQLRGDVDALAGIDRVAAARRALHDESQLYGLLVSFSDVAGCNHMAQALGKEPRDAATIVRLLDRACVHLERAGALFTRAVARNDGAALVAASAAAAAAGPLLDRAALRLASR